MPSLKTITTAAFIALTGATSIYAQSETTVDLDVFSSLLSSIAVPEDLPTAAQDIVTDATSVESIPTFTQPNIPTFTRPIFTVRTFTLPTAAPITTPVSPVPQCSDPKTLTCAKAVVGEALALPPACIDEIQRFNLNRTSSSSSQPGLPFTLSANSTSNIPQCVCPLLVNFTNCINPVCPASVTEFRKMIPKCFPTSEGVKVHAFGVLGVVVGVMAWMMM